MLLVHNTLQIYVIAQNLVDFKLLVLLGMGVFFVMPLNIYLSLVVVSKWFI